MSKAADKKKLAEVKLALALKTESLAKAAKGATKRRSLQYQATRFRRQLADIIAQQPTAQ